MLGFIFTRARATESRTTQLARDSSSQTLVHVASQVMASQTRPKWLLGESDLPSQTRPSNRALKEWSKKSFTSLRKNSVAVSGLRVKREVGDWNVNGAKSIG